MLRATTLDNGLTVVTEQMSGVRSVTAGFWVGVGSRDEAPAHAGASHFLEHLLFKGSATRSARSIAEAVDGTGGEMNAFTTKEYTAFYLRVLDDAFEGALDILSDIFWTPALRPADVEAERQVILDELLMHGDEPADVVSDLFCAALFPHHPLGRSVLGTADTIEAVTPEAVAAFHAAHYTPSNVVFAAAGRVDHDDTCRAMSSRMPDLPLGIRPTRSIPTAEPVGEVRQGRPTEQAHVAIGVRSVARDDPDRYPLEALAQIFGGGMSSRLFQEIREERGLAYSVGAWRSGYDGAGAFGVHVATSPEHLDEVIELLHAGFDGLRDEPVSARELHLAKASLRGSLLLGLEDSAARWGRIGRTQLIHRRVPEIDEVIERIDAITDDDLLRVADAVAGAPRVVATVGPLADDAPERQVA